MSAVRSMPCTACPYRRDVPSGLWSFDEYEKLRDYDKPTFNQPAPPFACHATPEHYCNGWAIVHTSRGNEYDLLALRLFRPEGGIPEPMVDLFDSGNDAADHGQADVAAPSIEAQVAIDRLKRKHPRLRDE